MEIKPSKKEITDIMRNASKENVAIVERAYDKAKEAHGEQTRYSGEPYFNHVYATAYKLAEVGMDPATIVAGFLHDTIEDERLTEKQVQDDFGEEVLFLVNGVTKLGKLKYKGVKRHTESLRKLFIATAQDIRVLIIRLADRLHNVQTLHGHPSDEKRCRIATETLEIFVPLADRLGIGQLRGELEDAAFPYAFPKEYEKVKELLKQRRAVNERYLEKVYRSLQKEFASQKIALKKMDYRVKRLYSLYRKLARSDMDIDKIYDLVALRVIVPTVEDCYRALGIIHGMWRPLPDRIKDYIATPKSNGYRSLHTSIFTGDGGIAEIQIRTPEMHEEAEYGVASHLVYKEITSGKNGAGVQKEIQKGMPWINQLLEWQKSVSESGEFLEHLKTDFFNDRVFAFTPKGDVIDLPVGSTVIDFAYAIHTDIGSHMSGAKINSKMVSIDTQLSDSDIVEIQTKKSAQPSPKWLKYAVTTLARRQIRNATNEQGFKLKNFLPNTKNPRLW